MSTSVEYQAFGGGPPSVALMILNVWGEINPPAQLVVFADTGGEKAETYRLLPIYEDWAAEYGLEFVRTQAAMGSLKDRILNHRSVKGVPIPAFTDTGMGKRMCTVRWKIQPSEKYLRARFGRLARITAQLGYTWEETHRMRDAKYKLTTNRFPLIEKRLTRQNCVEIIKMAGLPVPPWTACLFCPLQNNTRWREEAGRFPEDFKEAVAIDDLLRGRGEKNLWLHQSRKRLGDLYSTEQLSFPIGEDGGLVETEGCNEAGCHT